MKFIDSFVLTEQAELGFYFYTTIKIKIKLKSSI